MGAPSEASGGRAEPRADVGTPSGGGRKCPLWWLMAAPHIRIHTRIRIIYKKIEDRAIMPLHELAQLADRIGQFLQWALAEPERGEGP